MNLGNLVNNLIKSVKSNSPEIMTALGVGGVLTTSYLVAKATFTASEIIISNENEDPPSDDVKERFKERARQTWRLYIPAGISGAATIFCVVGSSRAYSKRATAAVTAYSLSEMAFNEYREKVVEQIGKNKEQKIRDDIVQDHVTNNPPNKEVVILSGGQVLCCELFTHRYFRSDMETLRKAQNDINEKIINTLYVTLDDFYDLIGLTNTSNSSKLGWDSDKLMELEFCSVLSGNGEPCLAFDYNYVKPLK